MYTHSFWSNSKIKDIEKMLVINALNTVANVLEAQTERLIDLMEPLAMMLMWPVTKLHGMWFNRKAMKKARRQGKLQLQRYYLKEVVSLITLTLAYVVLPLTSVLYIAS